MNRRIAIAVVIALGVIGASYSALRAQETRSVWDGVYSEAQATRGAPLFDRECAGCHGPDGEGGGMAPALSGAAFNANYDGQSVGDLFERNRTTMPVGKEGQLSGQQIADITAFMLQVNKFPAGASELAIQSMMLKQIKYLAQKPSTP
ncbi:MAG: cytochrome c [Acidobacteria bacterium]|nr:cytochrome c [Acidobacteriota bacterium]